MLDAIAAQCPAHQDKLLAQFRSARVTDRHNSGAGFSTDFEVDRHKALPVIAPSPLGNVWADIDGFEAPMTFLVFTKDGYACYLEGATCGDDTEGVDFNKVESRLHT
jgi:hypothetical protein